MITSIVIPTYNRAQELDRLLDSLKPFHSKEILVVDSGSTDNTRKIVERHRLANKAIRWLHLAERSIPRARNYGLNQAKGEVIIFVDSDITIASQCWQEALTAPLEDGRVGISYGRVTIPAKSLVQRYIRANQGSGTPDYGDRPLLVDRHNFITFPMCNTAIKKEVFEKVGDFDANMTWGEDIDLCRRAVEHFRLAYSPEATVEHNHRSTFKGLVKYAFDASYYTQALRRKYRGSEFADRYSLKQLAVRSFFPLLLGYGLLLPLVPRIAALLAGVVYHVLLLRYLLLKRWEPGKPWEVLLYPFLDIFYFGASSLGLWLRR